MTGDELDRTATQVRLDRKGSIVHEVVASWVDPWVGPTYRTRCDHYLAKSEGAILTTRGIGCLSCRRGGS